MGCWSESCAISGMEIPDGARIYIALVGSSRYGDGLDLIVPPVLGNYDDYGGLDLLEGFELLGLKKGENWRPRDDRRGRPVYMDADVYEFMAGMEPEFTYNRPKTIGGMIDKTEAELREAIKGLRSVERFEEGYFKAIQPLEKIISHSRDAFGDARQILEEILFKKKGESRDEAKVDLLIEEFITMFRRATIYNMGQIELRKTFVPEVRGPQHGGVQALIPFYGYVLTLARKREQDRIADCWNMEELDKEFPLERWKAECALDKTQLGFREWQVEQALEAD